MRYSGNDFAIGDRTTEGGDFLGDDTFRRGDSVVSDEDKILQPHLIACVKPYPYNHLG